MKAQLLSIPLDRLIPFAADGGGQYRDANRDLDQLVQSIQESGLKEPLTARPQRSRPGFYEVISGHRRLAACTKAGLKEVPVVVEDMDDAAATQAVMLGNAARVDAYPWEEGKGYADLCSRFGMSREKVAQCFGKSVGHVGDRIAVHEGAGQYLRDAFAAGDLGMGALQDLAKLPDRDLAPVECPKCGVILPEGSFTCSACRACASAWSAHTVI